MPRRRGMCGRRAAAALVLAAALAACGRPAPAPEQSPAERAKLLTIPDEYKNRTNPLPGSPIRAGEANLAEGRARYAQYCAVCHGQDGRGGTPLGRSLYPPASDLSSGKVRKYTDGQLYWIISEGVRFSGMPQGRLLHTEEQIWKLVLSVREIGHRGTGTQRVPQPR